jgi:hypothetical protein
MAGDDNVRIVLGSRSASPIDLLPDQFVGELRGGAW